MLSHGFQQSFVSTALRVFGLAPSISCNDWLGNKLAENLFHQYRNKKWTSINNLLDRLSKADHDLYHLCILILKADSKEPVLVNEWINHSPKSPHPHTVKGVQLIDWAWKARGSGTANTVSEKNVERFFERLIAAEESFQNAINLDANNPEPYCHLLLSGNGLQVDRDELDARFETLIQINPFHLPGHCNMLYAITEKWGGSHEEMFAFARMHGNKSPEGNPLFSLIAMAHIEKWSYVYMFDDNEAGARSYMHSKIVQYELKDAYIRSVNCNTYKKTAMESYYCGLFALAFYLCGNYELAADAMSRLNGVTCEYPWYYMADGIHEYFDAAYVASRVKKQLAI